MAIKSVLYAAIALQLFVSPVQSEPARIIGEARVIDGDTIDLGAVRIRLHGIDALEAGQQCRRSSGRSWQCGTASTERLAELAEGQAIECSALDRDAYGRVIGECWNGETNLNAKLVEEGLAWAYTRFSDDYAVIEAAAKAAGRGIWDGESEAPWDYRANRWERAAAASPREGCPIKGNINRRGDKIYHTPWSPWYERTKIDEAAGQRWFCDEAEAIAAGWRPAGSR